MRIVVLFCLSYISCFGQDVNEVLKKVQANYVDIQRLEYYSTYELFKGASDVLESRYSGYIYKENDLLYQKINSTEFVYGKNFLLKINSEQKAMELNKPQQMTYSGFDLKETLKIYSKKSMRLEKGSYVIELLPSISNTGTNKIVLIVDSKKYNLTQVDVYYSILQDFSKIKGKKDLNLPHLRIKIYNQSSNPVKKDELFVLSNYLENIQNTLKPVTKFQGYTFMDYR